MESDDIGLIRSNALAFTTASSQISSVSRGTSVRMLLTRIFSSIAIVNALLEILETHGCKNLGVTHAASWEENMTMANNELVLEVTTDKGRPAVACGKITLTDLD